MTAIGPHAGQRIEARGRPLGEGAAVMIMVHGRNAAPENILELVPSLDQPDFTYVAPAAHGNTWYPYTFLAPIERNEPGITSGISVIHDVIDRATAHGISLSRIVLLGFSQGACLAATAAVRRPARYGGIVVYSGGLIGPPGSTWEVEGQFDGTPVFLGCGDPDAHVPADRVRESGAVFERMGASVTERIYPGMGHTVSSDELEWTRGLMAQVVQRPL